MNPFAFVSLMASWLVLIFGTFVLSKNRRNSLNRLFFLFSMGSTGCAFTQFEVRQAETFETASYWLNLNNNILWPLTLAFLLHLVLIFVEEWELLKKKVIYQLIYFPAILFLALTQTTGLSIGTPEKVSWGWTDTIPDPPFLAYSSALWSVIIALFVLFLVTRYNLKQTDYTKKQQSKWVLLGLILCVAVAFITGIIFLLLRIRLPGFTITALAFSSIPIGYASLRYQLFALTPITASQSILAAMSDFLFLVTPEGTIQQVNQMTLQTLGYKESELIGQPLTKIFTGNNIVNGIFAEVGQISPSSPLTIHDIETTVITKAGRPISLSLSNSPIYDPADRLKGIVYLARDITERKRAEEVLRESEERFRTIFTESPISILLCDAEGRLLEENKAGLDLYGAVKPYKKYNLFKGPNVPDEIKTRVQQGETVRFEVAYDFDKVKEQNLYHTTKSGIIHLDVQITPLGLKQTEAPQGYLVQTQDITERKQAEAALRQAKKELEHRVAQRTAELQREIHEREQIEAALRENEARYRRLFEDSPIPLKEEDFSTVKQHIDRLRAKGVTNLRTYFDTNPGEVVQCAKSVKIIDVNKISLELYDSENKDELLKRGLEFGEEFYEVFKEELIMLAEGKTVLEIETVNQTMKGDQIYLLVRLSVAPGYEDTWAKVLVSTLDITARKRAEKARQDFEERRSNFVEITSHELRTPLTAIKGFVELLEHRELDKARRTQWFEILNRNVHRLERLVTGVSTLGQLERGIFRLSIEEVDFCKFLVEAMQPYLTFLEPDQLEVQSCSEAPPVFIEADSDRLLQILDNLMENAIKNTPSDQKKIIVTSEILPHRVSVRVIDDGAGIASEDLERIFEPFTSIQTQYSIGGAGIGLYIARMIAEAHGGTLTAHSAGKGHGATFILELPRVK